MNESISDFKPSQEQQKQSELSPQDNYNQLLDKYTKYSQRVRDLYNSKRTGENADLDKLKLMDIDSKRHDIHEELNKLGTTIGKSSEQIVSDTLFNEGNLKEIGIDTPVIKLPLLGVTFSLDQKNQKILSDDLQIPTQSLNTPNGENIAGIWQKYHPMDKSPHYKEEYSGNKDEIDKWTKSPFFAIVFTVKQYSNGIFFPPDYPLLYETRLNRLNNLAKDFNLNIFKANDVLGHQDYGPHCITGLEVSGDDLEKIGLIMKAYPEKYWLTPDELKDPYQQKFLKNESLKYEHIDSYLNKAINLKNPENSNWQDWYNFLRIYDVLNEKNPQLKEMLLNFYGRTYRDHNFKKLIDDSISKIPDKNYGIVDKMKKIAQETFPKE